MVFTNQTKNTSTITNERTSFGDLTWDEATMAWDEIEGTWDRPHESYDNQTKNTSVITNQSKS